MELTNYLESQHQRIRDLFHATKAIPTVSERCRLGSELKQLLYDHLDAEENWAFSRAMHAIQIDPELLDRMEDEHDLIRRDLSHTEGVTDSESEWKAAFEILKSRVLANFSHEEEVLFPRLRQYISELERYSLGEKLEISMKRWHEAG